MEGFSTEDANQRTMSVDVRQWCAMGDPEETRTLMLSLLSGVDVLSLKTHLIKLDIDVLSIGPDVIIASVPCAKATDVANIDGIARMEMPTMYEPRPTSTMKTGGTPMNTSAHNLADQGDPALMKTTD
jgi:hypothetical protein